MTRSLRSWVFLFSLTLVLPVIGRGIARADDAPAEGKGTFYLQPGDRVLFLGDSITAETKFYFMLYTKYLGKQYPDMCTNDGAAVKYGNPEFGTEKLKFFNGGLSGDIAAGGLKRLPGLVEKFKPTVVVVCFGMNDRYKDRKGYLGNMKAIVEKCKEQKLAVTILSAPSVCAVGHADLKSFVPIMNEMNQEVRKLAAEEKVSYVDWYTPTVQFQEKQKKDYTWGDGIHPNEVDGDRMACIALMSGWGAGQPLAQQGAARQERVPSPTSAPTEEK